MDHGLVEEQGRTDRGRSRRFVASRACRAREAWQEQGRLRVPWGRATVELPGVRVMASGLPHPQWNDADVYDPAAVDVEVLSGWYRHRAVPWGVHVPLGADWPP
jgi:hypothetical protein